MTSSGRNRNQFIALLITRSAHIIVWLPFSQYGRLLSGTLKEDLLEIWLINIEFKIFENVIILNHGQQNMIASDLELVVGYARNFKFTLPMFLLLWL